MKLLIYSDNHWSEKASITVRLGLNYTERLEMLIKSMNWAMKVAADYDCKATICAGDFFDKPQLTDQELTALREINWLESIPHYFLVGNHESEENDLHFSSTKALEGLNRIIIDSPQSLIFENSQLHFIPYIVERNRQSITEYISNKNTSKHQVIISHNDIAGINYGPVISKTGFNIDEIEANCQLCLNGHIHNSEYITKKIVNLGSISAHNFTNDSFKYQYGLWILDTETLELTFIENPFAFNFYKITIEAKKDIKQLSNIKNNAVISLKCYENFIPEVKKKLEELKDKIIDTRLIFIKNPTMLDEGLLDTTDLSLDHLSKFIECCRDKLGDSDILEAELEVICN